MNPAWATCPLCADSVAIVTRCRRHTPCDQTCRSCVSVLAIHSEYSILLENSENRPSVKIFIVVTLMYSRILTGIYWLTALTCLITSHNIAVPDQLVLPPPTLSTWHTAAPPKLLQLCTVYSTLYTVHCTAGTQSWCGNTAAAAGSRPGTVRCLPRLAAAQAPPTSYFQHWHWLCDT